jgi:hypothetical protein
MKILQKAYEKGKNHFDYKNGALASMLGGIAIGLINYQEGINSALSSGGKEAAKILALASFNLKTAEKLATRIKNKPLAIATAGLVTGAIATGITYAIHELAPGTPCPFYSTLPTLATAPFAFAGWGWRKRNKLEKTLTENPEPLLIKN